MNSTKEQCMLVPTDFSDYATEAMHRAVRLAGLLEARIHVLYVMETAVMNYASDIDGMPMPVAIEVDRSLLEMAQKRMETWLGSWADADVTHEIVQDPTPLARVICQVAEDKEVQLIVMGKHGHQSALEHLLIGSTTERVVRHASCSVLVAMPHGILGEAS
ncbi:MAG: universal stress protein [Mariprofundaceae bacterium]|nr:universal stress protein [Mariprofundaceae bacterium]